MKSSEKKTLGPLKRMRLAGVVFTIIGLYFLTHGIVNLRDIYSRPINMFEMGSGLSPEKGSMWSAFLAGMSVSLIGILLFIKAGMDLKNLRTSKDIHREDT